MDAVVGKIGTTAAALNPDPKSREEWLNCEPRTRKLYIRSLRHVMGWSTSIRHLPVSQIKPAQLRDYLNLFTPGQRKNIRDALSSLFGIAGEESMLETNPLNGKKAGLKRQVKKKGKVKKKVECWPRDDVTFYANIARTTPAWMNFTGKRTKRTWPGGSIMVQLMYETAADSTDVMTWTKQEHLVEREGYRGVDFDRGKTGQPTFIPLSAGLLREIDANGALHLVTDPLGMPYTAVVDDARMRGHMITLQEQVVKAGGAKRIYDYLRHSAATEAEEMGMELEKVRHPTAHKDPSMLREVYVQQSAKITVEIQLKRGLIGTDERQNGNESLPVESAG
jgi:integrase